MKVKTQKTVKEGENVGNGADKNGKAAGDGVAAENNKVCQVRAVNQFVQTFTFQISRNSTAMVMLEMGSPLETPLHSSSKTGSVKMKTLRNLSEIHARLSQHPVHQLSLGQAGVGVVAVLGQLLVSLCNDVHLQLATMGEGFFCGLVFLTVGGLGVFTAGRATRFTVRWTNILI